MIKPLTVSLVIVSRNRPENLRRLLVSLRFLDHPEFEVIVVSDIDPAKDLPDLWGREKIKFIRFDAPNISQARNLGLAEASGRIAAFIDDDAVPEPSWLSHLIAPFADEQVGAAGGYVRGRNGISFQWTARSFDRCGQHHPLDMTGTGPQVMQGTARLGIKTEGTNCAFRRDALLALGGFDLNFRYYLDETDLNYRLGLAGWKTAIVPLAQVHHGYAPNALRASNRAPLTLYEIGASKSYFLRRHADPNDWDDALTEFRKEQKIRLISFMQRGTVPPEAVPGLMKTLEAGLADGANRNSAKPDLNMADPDRFQPFTEGQPLAAPVFLFGSRLKGRAMSRRAKELAAHGITTTVFRFSYTSLFHRHSFQPDGYWLQTGGIYGRAERGTGLFRLTTLATRAATEFARLSDVRPKGRLIRWDENL